MSYQEETATPKEVAAKTNTQTGANTHTTVWHGHYGEAALRLARDGWKVLPLRVRGKEPLSRLAPRGANSATTTTGNLYQWVEYPQAAEELPHTTRERLTPRYEPVSIQQRATAGQARGFSRYVDAAMSDVRPGNRNATLFRLACKATQEGQSEHVFDMLRSRFVQAGLSLGEVDRTIVSACRYIIANPNVHTSKQVKSWR